MVCGANGTGELYAMSLYAPSLTHPLPQRHSAVLGNGRKCDANRHSRGLPMHCAWDLVKTLWWFLAIKTSQGGVGIVHYPTRSC